MKFLLISKMTIFKTNLNCLNRELCRVHTLVFVGGYFKISLFFLPFLAIHLSRKLGHLPWDIYHNLDFTMAHKWFILSMLICHWQWPTAWITCACTLQPNKMIRKGAWEKLNRLCMQEAQFSSLPPDGPASTELGVAPAGCGSQNKIKKIFF